MHAAVLATGVAVSYLISCLPSLGFKLRSFSWRPFRLVTQATTSVVSSDPYASAKLNELKTTLHR